ncbi:phosphate ABC transporter permease [Alcaligenes faecalis subsp. faecalis NCIB 8687]|uniref:Phosphate transport system permease protein PstA n=1 Tax=Alcaligenes faecalis TaxID=511 RepID=Q6WB52_ALCFA|nr:phosphate permease [Alcaligenes faecalis subsp. faecalis NCIB 8687]EJC61969.1 phosphate ABC transporter permease [Alcaligenes faecalis subsp. faecalis NCIB 8687]
MATNSRKKDYSAINIDETKSIQLVRYAKRSDIVFSIAGVFVLLVSMGLLVTVLLDLALDGAARISFDFLTSFPSRKPEAAGILSAWVGTTLVMIVTAFLAIPLGVLAGLYLEEYAPKNWFTTLIEVNISNLAGVPSIIYGLLALGLFVYMFDLGQTVFVAGAVLALLILPVIIVSTREAVRSIPQVIKEGAYGMGADKWQTMTGYILPAARPGILTGAIVGLSRAIGETAPVITIGALTYIAFLPTFPFQGDFPYLNFDWLNSPFTVMPIQMFNWLSRPQTEFHVNAAATGLILIGMTVVMNLIAIVIRFKLRRRNVAN